MPEQRLKDVATLARSALLSGLPLEEIGVLLGALVPITIGQGASLEPSSAEPALYFVLDGELELEDGSQRRKLLGPSDVFGETALAGRSAGERAVALSEARLARLSAAVFTGLGETQPRTALHLMQGALRAVSERLLEAEARAVHAGAQRAEVRVGERLPREVEGALVVAGREGENLLALDALTTQAAVITPVTTRDWEGRDVYRRSAGLVLLEAARQLGLRLRLGPSITSGRLVFVDGDGDRKELAQVLDARFSELCRAASHIREELWSVADAIELFRQQDDEGACLLLEDSLESFVTLHRCGETWAAVPGPLLPHAGELQGVHVLDHPLGLLLDFGPRIRDTLPRRSTSTLAFELRAPRYGAPMTRSQAEWLELMGVSSVGTFNRVCVQGRVAELIRVSEGFHEKRIAEIADQIKQRGDVRIVAVAGPSSSGKTTFIKRLLVQLRVNGIEPLELSLDDYYLDRARQQPDASGELDFEVLGALDLPLLRDQLAALLRGEPVRPPRYDFQLGQSRPAAGPELRLEQRSVLLLEGIHALNPELYGVDQRRRAFGVFIHPAASLGFDRLSSLEPADVRLLRRIVRDRHQRGFAAAETLARWPTVRRGERLHIFPFQGEADAVFDSSLIYEVSVLRVYAERYLLEVPRTSPHAPSARRLRQLLQLFVPIHPDHVPPTSILREFIGGSGFSY